MIKKLLTATLLTLTLSTTTTPVFASTTPTTDTGWKYYYKGRMATGIVQIQNKMYYLNESGTLITTDWIQYGNYKMYADDNGVLITGWRKIDGKWYYFSKSRMMLTGTVELEVDYLIQYRLQGNKGFFYYEYELLDEANKDLATEVHATQNRKSESEKNHNPKKVGMDKNEENHTLEMEDMDNGYSAEVGVYNNKDSNNTDLNNTNTSSTSSSSSSSDDFAEVFENNICELKETTKIKFKEYCDKCDPNLIKTILEYSADINIKSFAGFKTIIDSVIEKDIMTAEEFKKDIETYRADKKKKTSSKKNNSKNTANKRESKELRFNNFEPRQYDYNSLEKKLLGWE